MNLNPVVSAVIPTRNRPDLVCRAVKSVLAQTFIELEVVVVVDGPDPATVATLEQLRDSRVRVISLDQSVGGAEARNVGAREARGEWVALLDDDDEWLPEKISDQLELARSSKADKILVASRFVFRESGKPDVVAPRLLPAERKRISEYPFASHSGFQTSVFFCNRPLILATPFTKDLRGMQDLDWFLRVMADSAVDLLVSPKPLSIYYSPEKRATISAGLGLEMPLGWAQANSALMSRRAYSLFIVRTCVRRAVDQRAGWKGFWTLWYECMFKGSPTVSIVVLFFTRYLVSDEMRYKLRTLIAGQPL
jgi:glycosyltransferase involved in cell wall biosynthesis